MNKKSNNLFLLLSLTLFEVFLLALINLTYLIADLGIYHVVSLRQFTWPIALFLVLLTGYTVILTHRLFQRGQREVEQQIHAENLKHIMQLLNTVRMQRHDFMHHAQTVYGLLEIGEFSEARQYLSEQFGVLVIHEELSKIRNPGILALLITKIAQAESRNIKLEILAETDLANLDLPVSQVNIILGNILDNALEAVNCLDLEKRSVYLTLSQTSDYYLFYLKNYGPPIEETAIHRIFDLGFSTKRGGKGLGLYSVKQSIERLNGKIEVTSNMLEGTTFKITLPKGGG